jgi:hypothetical protein
MRMQLSPRRQTPFLLVVDKPTPSISKIQNSTKFPLLNGLKNFTPHMIRLSQAKMQPRNWHIRHHRITMVLKLINCGVTKLKSARRSVKLHARRKSQCYDLRDYGADLLSRYNMPTSIAQVTQGEVVGQAIPPPVNPADIKYEPRYTIDSTFTNIVTNWVKNAFNGHNKPFMLQFKSSGATNKATDGLEGGFADIGFSNNITLDKDKVVPILPLFTASYGQKSVDKRPIPAVSTLSNHKLSPKPVQNVPADEALPEPTFSSSIPMINTAPNLQAGVGQNPNSFVIITIQASDASVFAISPDQSW